MKTLKKIAFVAVVSLGLLATNANADSDKGTKVYQKKLKSSCGFSGAVFAAKHTQDEWAEAKEDGKLIDTMIEICPAGKDFLNSTKFKKKFAPHLYDFVHDFASDSGNIPSC